jgi:hypothetical protein
MMEDCANCPIGGQAGGAGATTGAVFLLHTAFDRPSQTRPKPRHCDTGIALVPLACRPNARRIEKESNGDTFAWHPIADIVAIDDERAGS